ncbi:hypothetical protein H7H51_06460 [Mycolicibacterium farcinogenes]|nr:hypothetical protein [Mycolicibacterium farcinogenes]
MNSTRQRNGRQRELICCWSSNGRDILPREGVAIMKFRVVGLIGVFALVAACGGGESAEHGPMKQTSAPPESAPSATLDQPAPEHGAVADTDPLKALADGVFMVTRDARATPAEIAGYQSLIATGDSLKTSTFIFADGSWRPKDVSQLIFSPSKGEWVESDRSFTVSAGPQGGSGWPTVESVGASGTGFYTLYRTDLSGAPLPDGLKRAMSEGAVLPESVTAATFSAGAVAFDMAHTAVDPEFTLDRIPQRNAAPKVRPVQACGTPSAECTTWQRHSPRPPGTAVSSPTPPVPPAFNWGRTARAYSS